MKILVKFGIIQTLKKRSQYNIRKNKYVSEQQMMY